MELDNFPDITVVKRLARIETLIEVGGKIRYLSAIMISFSPSISSGSSAVGFTAAFNAVSP